MCSGGAAQDLKLVCKDHYACYAQSKYFDCTCNEDLINKCKSEEQCSELKTFFSNFPCICRNGKVKNLEFLGVQKEAVSVPNPSWCLSATAKASTACSARLDSATVTKSKAAICTFITAVDKDKTDEEKDTANLNELLKFRPIKQASADTKTKCNAQTAIQAYSESMRKIFLGSVNRVGEGPLGTLIATYCPQTQPAPGNYFFIIYYLL